MTSDSFRPKLSRPKYRGYVALFQKALSADPKIEVAVAMPCSRIMFWKRVLRKYVNIYALIHI